MEIEVAGLHWSGKARQEGDGGGLKKSQTGQERGWRWAAECSHYLI